MIEFLFLDLDDTILDFHKAERIALTKTLTQFSIAPTDSVCARYSALNKLHWQALERGELSREQVKVGRFRALLNELGADADAGAVAERYEENLCIGHYFLPGAQEALVRLAGKYRLFLASNGTARVQAGRIASAGIAPLFEAIFVSEEIGANKPEKAYFDRCFARIANFDPKKAMIVGDSLTSDILGGKNANIATCWVNPRHESAETITPDYQIEDLAQLEALLEEVCTTSI